MKILEILEIQERKLQEEQHAKQPGADPIVERVQSRPTSHIYGLDPILDAETIERIELYKHSDPALYKKITSME